MSDSPDIDAILSDIVTLPSLPGTITKVLEQLKNPESSLHEVGQLISTDPAIALKTLRLINSAQYGMRQHVTSVEHAVALLGPRVIKNLVLSAAVFDQLNKGTDRFIRHSIACGIAMEMLSDGCSRISIPAEEAFVYGILHDVGTIIIQEYMPENHAKSAALAKSEQIPMYVAEQRCMGIDHAQIGGRLAQHWRLPHDLVWAITAHHDLDQCAESEYRPLAALIAVANYITCASGFAPGDWPDAPVPPGAWEETGLTGPDMPAILDRFFEALPNLNELVDAVT